MIKAILCIAFILFANTVQAAETVNYADYYNVPVKTESSAQATLGETPEIQKGLEFAVENKPSTSNHINEVSVKNEYPESLKVVFEAIGEKIEIYLNAYELMEKLSLNQNSEYKIKVYNIYNDYLGYIRSSSVLAGQLKISPFLLVADSVVVEQPIISPAKPESKPQSTSDQVSTTSSTAPPPSVQLSKRPLRIANISNSQIHIDITETNGHAMGEGWTVANDIYEPQFLNLQSQPIQVSDEAQLIVTKVNNQTTVQKKAKELNIDEKGNYVWLIDNITVK